jgi:AcrR family transcriptional regulator
METKVTKLVYLSTKEEDMARQADMREHIFGAASELFFQFGFSKVTTDEIAASAGISKKTLYKYFDSKEVLFTEVIGRTIQALAEEVEATLEDGEADFPEKLSRLIELRAAQLSRIKQPLISDVQRNFPALWKQVEEERRTKLEAYLGQLLGEGVKQGVFRPDIDAKMLEMVYMSAITGIINPENLARIPYSAQEATDAIMRIIFTGVLTEKARKDFPERGKVRQKR